MSVALLLLLVACFPDPEPTAVDPCVACHGSPETGPAPPTALGGSENPALLGVGAHQAHVTGPALAEAVPCSECHLWPDAVDAPGHTDTPWPAEVGWGEVGKAGGAAAPWDRTTGTCTVWCHGAGLTGASEPAPSWTDTDGSASRCGACHGNPPPAPHSQSAACATCHGDLTPETHLDGEVTCAVAGDTGATTGPCNAVAACAACHGSGDRGVPPPDLQGNTDTTARGVGAHAAHLAGSATAAAVGCWSCHVETLDADRPGHGDGVVDVVWSAALTAPMHGVTPVWDPVALTCTVGCHLQGTPVWTEVGAGHGACGSCHALPPDSPGHPYVFECELCHGSTIGPGLEIVNPANHVNGVVDF